jgi:hypothetical protein
MAARAAGEGGDERAAAFTAGLGSVLTHPARPAAAEAEAPAIILRRVRRNMMKPTRNGLAGFYFVKHKYDPRYDGYVTLTNFLGRDLGKF